MPKVKEIKMRFIEDPGHGWAEVPAGLCKRLGLGTDYPSRGGMYYLEEDCEVGVDLMNAVQKHGYTVKFDEAYVDDFDAWMQGDEWPAARTINW